VSGPSQNWFLCLLATLADVFFFILVGSDCHMNMAAVSVDEGILDYPCRESTLPKSLTDFQKGYALGLVFGTPSFWLILNT
jgi:hypothetical protein